MLQHKRKFKTAISIFFLTLIMVKFQNCGHQAGVEDYDDGGEMRIVDDWAEKSVALIEDHKALESNSTSAQIDGLCSRKGEEVIHWEIDGLSGDVQCQLGGFRILIEELDSLDCDTEYELFIESNDVSDSMIINKACEQVAGL